MPPPHLPPVSSSSASAPIIHFSKFAITPQVFHLSPSPSSPSSSSPSSSSSSPSSSKQPPLTMAFVNLKPLLPGHVLVSPLRCVPRLADLSAAEVSSLFATVQLVSRMLSRVYRASALNVAVQDGADAGQSVPHVHCHVIPRRKGDGDGGAAGGAAAVAGEEGEEDGSGGGGGGGGGEQGGDDDDGDGLYARLEGEEGDVGAHLRDREGEKKGSERGPRPRFPKVHEAGRRPRSEDEMREEAEWLGREMEVEVQMERKREAGEAQSQEMVNKASSL